MDINTVNTVRDFIHASSIALLIMVAAAGTIGAIKPRMLRLLLREFAERKYIIAGGVFMSLLCGTIFTATQADYRPTYETQNAKQIQQERPKPIVPSEEPQVQGATSAPQPEQTQSSSTSTRRRTTSPSTQPASTPAPAPAQSSPTQTAQTLPEKGSPQSAEKSNSRNCKVVHVGPVCL